MDKQDDRDLKSPKQFDLESVITLLKTYNVPKHLEPMQNVVYSTVQMFGASWLATTQSLSSQFHDFQKQKQYINQLEDRINAVESELAEKSSSTQCSNNCQQNHASDTNEIKDILDSLQHQQSTMIEEIETLRTKINQIETNQTNANSCDASQTEPNKAELAAIQNVLQVHGKKISELIKRYKRHHNDINVLKTNHKSIEKQLNEHESNLQTQIQTIVNNQLSKNHGNSIKFDNDDIMVIKDKIKILEKMTISELDSLKDNLAAHEMEHEGIINQILQDMASAKQNGGFTSHNSTSLAPDFSAIDAKIDAKISPMQEELETFVNDKTSKLISTVKKLMSDMGHKIVVSQNNKISKQRSSPHSRSASMYSPTNNHDSKQMFVPNSSTHLQSPNKAVRSHSKRIRSTSFDMR